MTELLVGLVVGLLVGALGSLRDRGEIKRVTEANAQLLAILFTGEDHRVRMERVDRGLSEVTAPGRDKDPMPAQIYQLTRLFPAGGGDLRKAAMRLRNDGASWGDIEAHIRSEIEQASPGLLRSVGV